MSFICWFVICILDFSILYNILYLLAAGFICVGLFILFCGKSQTVHENGIMFLGLDLRLGEPLRLEYSRQMRIK